MCDASDFAMGTVLGQKQGKILSGIYYAIKTLNYAQENYVTIEKEPLLVVLALDKFSSYIFGSHVIVYVDYSTIETPFG